MFRLRFRALAAMTAAGLAASIAAAQPVAADDHASRHVLLISVDGLHQSDLAWYVAIHPDSALASLVHRGVEFTHAQTPFPSDSFPGMVGQVTGGNPKTTGVYYDDSFNHALLPAGTASCAGVAPGVEVTYFEQADLNQHSLDAGQGLAGLPGSILEMTGNPRTVIDLSQLPVDPATCKPVYPHQYLKVNTVFEVARAAGLRTAWSDKHPAYEILNGPSGAGIQDLFTPEINSDAPTLGSSIDWTKDNGLTMQYDGYKVQSVINEINGFDHSGLKPVGMPAIFGMNFQTVATAQKLPKSDGLAGGYLGDGVTPGPLLSRALDYIDAQVGAMKAAIRHRHLEHNTTLILSAKHGQSPQTPSALTRNPGRPHHRRAERCLAGGLSIQGSTARCLRRRRRRLADVDQRPLGLRHQLRQELPAQPLRRRQRHQRQPEALHELGTTQIAPTILALLDLNPRSLQAVQIEHTRVLPLDD